MKKLITYFRESFVELKENVTWPEWAELSKSSIMVIVALFFSVALLFSIDKVIGVVLQTIYGA